MFGKNKIKAAAKGDGKTLEIFKIFRTFQGEGPYTGWPAVFIRLSGCNLACKFCDTDFDDFVEMAIEDILSEVGELSRKTPGFLVVITGGEPFRQPISGLCDLLIDAGYLVQIETNGTLFIELNQGIKIVCSPKITNGKYYPIREDLLERISAFKFIISDSQEGYNNVSDVGQSRFDVPVYVQPMDEYDAIKNRKNHTKTLEIASKNNYRLCVQTHKIWEVE